MFSLSLIFTGMNRKNATIKKYLLVSTSNECQAEVTKVGFICTWAQLFSFPHIFD